MCSSESKIIFFPTEFKFTLQGRYKTRRFVLYPFQYLSIDLKDFGQIFEWQSILTPFNKNNTLNVFYHILNYIWNSLTGIPLESISIHILIVSSLNHFHCFLDSWHVSGTYLFFHFFISNDTI